jgi:hypothetical protein
VDAQHRALLEELLNMNLELRRLTGRPGSSAAPAAPAATVATVATTVSARSIAAPPLVEVDARS